MCFGVRFKMRKEDTDFMKTARWQFKNSCIVDWFVILQHFYSIAYSNDFISCQYILFITIKYIISSLSMHLGKPYDVYRQCTVTLVFRSPISNLQ